MRHPIVSITENVLMESPVCCASPLPYEVNNRMSCGNCGTIDILLDHQFRYQGIVQWNGFFNQVWKK